MRLAGLLVLVAFVFTGFGYGVQAQTSGNVTVLAVCNTEPETTAILNNTETPIMLISLSSIKDPQPYEPIVINQELPPGEVLTFYLGPTAPAPALSPLRIYDNTAPDEGAVLVTSIGTVTALCGSGALSLVGQGSTVAASPTAIPAPVSPPAASPITPPSTGSGGLR